MRFVVSDRNRADVARLASRLLRREPRSSPSTAYRIDALDAAEGLGVTTLIPRTRFKFHGSTLGVP